MGQPKGRESFQRIDSRRFSLIFNGPLQVLIQTGAPLTGPLGVHHQRALGFRGPLRLKVAPQVGLIFAGAVRRTLGRRRLWPSFREPNFAAMIVSGSEIWSCGGGHAHYMMNVTADHPVPIRWRGLRPRRGERLSNRPDEISRAFIHPLVLPHHCEHQRQIFLSQAQDRATRTLLKMVGWAEIAGVIGLVAEI